MSLFLIAILIGQITICCITSLFSISGFLYQWLIVINLIYEPDALNLWIWAGTCLFS